MSLPHYPAVLQSGFSPATIAICGAGPVGMALAALLVLRGQAPARISLIDARGVDAARADPRSIAISYGSRQILEEIGAWPVTASPIHQIHVSRRGQFGRSLIDCADHGLPALGYVCRYGDLVAALSEVCARLGVSTLRPAQVTASLEQHASVQLTIEHDGISRSMDAAIVVQAEGGLFGGQQQRSVHRDYRQSAIIAQVRASAPMPQRAFERFTGEGPLALLPQGEEYSLVWCVRPEAAQGLLALDDAAFLAELGKAFGNRVGQFTGTSARIAYRLGLNAGPEGSARTVAIGNAAQTLHPVAGQGLNLGLRDAAVLARLLARDATPAMLAEFVALRQRDRQLTVRLTDTMARVFAGNGPAQALLGASLAAIDLFAPARSLLAELMMYGRR